MKVKVGNEVKRVCNNLKRRNDEFENENLLEQKEKLLPRNGR
jgi:hypothetical protein